MTNAPRNSPVLPTNGREIRNHLTPIIQAGDVQQLVETAERLGQQLVKDRLATAQIRNIFGTARRIQAGMNHQDNTPALWREFVLLKPKLAYQAKRKPEVTRLASWLTEAIDLVERDPQRFIYFMDFFEATLAYHTANGGTDKEERARN